MRTKRGYYDLFLNTCARCPSNNAVVHYKARTTCIRNLSDPRKNSIGQALIQSVTQTNSEPKEGEYIAYTYSELYGVCEYISQNLQQLECDKGIVGILSQRNCIIPCAIAAAHKCNTAFMFLDPSRDAEAAIQNIKIKVVIAIGDDSTSYCTELCRKNPERTIYLFKFKISFYYFTYLKTPKPFFTHSFISTTSGTTGEPKHILVPIHCIQPNVDDLTKMFEIVPSDVIYFSTPLTFDPSMIEILLACMNGATLLIAPERLEVLFPANPKFSVTFWQTTPSKFFLLNQDIGRVLGPCSTLKILALGGEPLCGVKRLKESKDKHNTTKIFTLYGVTEMSCWACATELDLEKIEEDREIPLGPCLSETELILQPNNGEGNIGSIFLKSKTRRCIVLNQTKLPEKKEVSAKLIDTGDLAEIKNGTIYYRGRRDEVIKRFGHRVNTLIIESTVMLCPKITACACIWLQKPMLLVVYYSSETFNCQDLTNFLKCKLDDKHWPDKIIRVASIPINEHGKVSKKVLTDLYNSDLSQTISENSFKETFMTELNATLVSDMSYEEIKDKDFFSIGGTSFTAITICNRISQCCPEFGKILLPNLVTRRHTIDKIVQQARKRILNIETREGKRKKTRRRSSANESTALPAEEPVVKRNTNTPSELAEFVVLWTYDTGKCIDASPTIFETELRTYVTVGSHSGQIVSFDALTGASHGVLTLPSRVEAAVYCFDYPPSWPRGVVGAYDGTIVCFNLEHCREIWRINIGSMIKSKATSCGKYLYVASYDGIVRCIHVANGKIKETIKLAEQAISADLVLAKNQYVLLGTLSGVCASIETETNTVVWRGTLGSPVFASPVLYDEDKYVVFAEVGGEIHCRTVEKGIKIWRYQGAKGNIFSSIYVKEVKKRIWQMVFGCHNNHVYSIQIKHFQPNLHWAVAMPSPVYSTPCGFKDSFVLAAANNGCLCVINSNNGDIVAEYNLPHETFSTPAVHGDHIFIGCRNDHFYALKFTP